MTRRVRDINWNDPKYRRVGMIPVIEQGKILFFGFCIEPLIGAISDLGGHRDAEDIDGLHTLIREYQEESFNIFGTLTKDMLQDCLVLENKRNLELLIPLKGPFYKYTERFHQLLGSNTEHEAQNIIWLSQQQLLNTIDTQEESYSMYGKLYNILRINRHVIQSL